MRLLIDACRFFVVVPPVSRMMTMTFVVVVATAALLVALDPRMASGVMRPLLLLQVFAVSSGYLVPARRGHYDLLLTRGPGRLLAAAVHAAMSAAPGMTAWCSLCLAETIVVGDGLRSIGTFGSAAALFIVSSVGWALTAPLPRFAGAVGWLLLRAGLDVLPAVEAVDSLPPDSLAGWAARVTRVLVLPETLVGIPWSTVQVSYAWPALGMTAGWLYLAVRGMARANLRLEAGQ